uniref:Transmembrane protein n=1 Tax=Alexandrium catenella TaxID=2925 RepID=A0A7S1S7H4_ALECA|mmetsp:Transcript_86804/g.230639  ORF Transcript_86804/g.230639 Transcript_86804/m.230639 type:complete len:287 (+) Transcript_86804:77-937(+)
MAQAQPLIPKSGHFDTDTFLCCALPTDAQAVSSAFVNDRLLRLRSMSKMNFALAIGCLVYIGVNVVSFIINTLSEETMDKYKLDLPFHLVEFWATFFFSLVEAYIIVFSPRSLGEIYARPAFLKFIIFFNVVSSFVPACLVTFSLEIFEVPGHNLEYVNELALAFLDAVMAMQLSYVARRQPSLHEAQTAAAGTLWTAVAIGVPLLLAVAQILIYNLMSGDSGEVWAHYLEFTFAIGSATVSFLFCMDNKFLVDQLQATMIREWCNAPSSAPSKLQLQCSGCVVSP